MVSINPHSPDTATVYYPQSFLPCRVKRVKLYVFRHKRCIGQVNAVDAVISSLGLDIPIAGLAKRDEEIWRPHASQPVCLPKRSDALRLLQRVRDETHRFATSRNQELRTKENTVSPFVKLPHVGKERDTLLMKTYGTLAALAAAPEADIARLLHVRANAASEILLAAQELLRKQEAEQAKERLSLELPGTTKEKAARSKLNANLAAAALETDGFEAETGDGTLLVASHYEDSAL